MKDTKVLPGFHVFRFHPNVIFHNSCPFFKFIFHNLPSQKDPDYSCNLFKSSLIFSRPYLLHITVRTEDRHIFKMAETITVPRLVNVGVPSKADNQSPHAPLLLALLLSPSLYFYNLCYSILILAYFLRRYWQLKEVLKERKIFYFELLISEEFEVKTSSWCRAEDTGNPKEQKTGG